VRARAENVQPNEVSNWNALIRQKWLISMNAYCSRHHTQPKKINCISAQ